MSMRLAANLPPSLSLERVLASHGAGAPEDVALVRAAVRDVAFHPAGADIMDGRDSLPAAVVSGWVARAKLFADGRRQIVSLHLPGDVLPAQEARLQGMGYVALTDAATAGASLLAAAVMEHRAGHERLAAAWSRVLCDSETRLLRQLVRLGRLSAYERTADLLVELHERQTLSGETAGAKIFFPITQEVLADVLGLSIVHANRVLQQLRRERLVVAGSGRMWSLDIEGLSAAAMIEQA